MSKQYRIKDTAELFERLKKAGPYISSLGSFIQNENVIVSDDDVAAWEKKIDGAMKALAKIKELVVEQIHKHPKVDAPVEDLSKDIVGDPF
jgi:hypothetical protein